jgi:4-azaleucine resistance transporter AzlC
MNKSLLTQAAKITLPVLFGYLAIGIPFGLMIVNAGYPWWIAPVMSTLMYAGAGQYMAVGLFAAGASLGTIAVTELFINIRHIVYGLSLITKLKDTGKWKPYIVFALTDETYSLLTSCPLPEDVAPGPYYGTIALLDHLYWIAGSTIGAAAGTLLPFKFTGVDFALTALFAILLIGQIEQSHDALPPVIGGICVTMAIILSRFGILPAQHILLIALALGITALILIRGKGFSEAKTENNK